jgi:hypothetical protein
VLPVGKVKDWRSEKRRRSENVGGKTSEGSWEVEKRRSDWQLESWEVKNVGVTGSWKVLPVGKVLGGQSRRAEKCRRAVGRSKMSE